MNGNKAGRARLASLCAFAALFLLASCGRNYDFEGKSLVSYAEAKGGVILNLTRDRESVFGSWEDPSQSRYGLVEGDAKADAGLKLRFYGAVTAVPVGVFEGRYAEGESRIEGKLAFGSGDAKDASFFALPDTTSKLRVLSSRATTREGLPESEADPTRFMYFGFEPTAPATFRDAYRSTFQGGRDLKAAVDREREDFFVDFKGTTAQLKEQSGEAAVHAWYYEGRQMLSYRSGGLLVMALRRGIFTGTADPSQSLRYAVIDEATGKVLGPADFLAEGWEEKLPALLETSLREELGLDASLSLVEQGLPFDKPPVSPDFFVYSKGLGFHYATGSLVAAKAGELFVLLPFDRLGGLLKPEAATAWKLGAAQPGGEVK